MRRWLVTIGIAVVCVVRVGADLTITTTTTMEGKMVAMTPAGNMVPTIITRIKGSKSRTDVEMRDESVATLIDLTTKQMILLRPGQKTAQLLDPTKVGVGPGSVPMPKMETTVKPTGQKRDIDGAPCDEFAVDIKMDMSAMASPTSGDMPPAAAAILKDLQMSMKGSVWVAKQAPGSAEYRSFQTTAAKLAIAALSGGAPTGMPTGIEQMLTGFADAPGIPYLTELTMFIDGTGPMVEMMKQMGDMKIVSRVTAVSTDPLPDVLFTVPEDYKMVKQ